jgi:hypothetical protein
MSWSAGFRAALGFGAALAAAIACSGCAGQSSTVDRWLGREPAPAASGQVFYCAVDGLTVYAGPSRSSAVVGRLSLHEQVVRSKLEGGYARVRAGRTGVEGWVDNAQLLWRLPAGAAPAAPSAGEPAQPETEPAETPAEKAPPPTGEPETPTREPSKPTPSVFDRF